MASICAGCGNTLAEGDQFCRVCGRAAGPGSPQAVASPVPVGPAETSSKAVISFVCGLLMFIPLAFVAAGILGLIRCAKALPMLQACSHCAAQMPETASFCPSCGQPMQPEPRAEGKVGPFPEKIAGALAYATFIPAAVFLLLQPYKKNGFIRFHSIQCVLLWISVAAVAAALRLAALLLFMLPMAGPLLVLLASGLLALAAVLIWVVLVVKALQGEMFKLPLLGSVAADYAAQGLDKAAT